MTDHKQTCVLFPDCNCQPEEDCRAITGRPARAPARIIHPPIDGQHLAREKNPPRVSLAGKILLTSLAIVLMCTISSMIIRHLAEAETAYQLAARV